MITPTDLADLARERMAETSVCDEDNCTHCAVLRTVLAYEAQCDKQFADALALWTVHDHVPEIEYEAGQ